MRTVYLDPLDHLMAERGFEMVRYADDFVVMCRSEEAAAAALATFRRKIDVFGSTINGLRPSEDRRAAGGHF
jgi:RNA-directed DNA polymerase